MENAEGSVKPNGQQRRERFSPGMADQDHGVVFEQIRYHGEMRYARSDDPGIVEPSVTPNKDDRTQAPVSYRVLDELPWPAPAEPEGYVDEAYLFTSIEEWLRLHIDYKDPRCYPVTAAWIMQTWTPENWRVSPPLYLLGPINSGKTTVLECLEQLSYRAVRAGSMSTAVMFRLSDAYGPSLLIDEAQIYNREELAEAQALINESYRRGGRVWRMVGEGHSMTPRSFNCYGPRAFASTRPPWEALMSRALLVHMEKNTRQVEETLTPLFAIQADRLRAQLLQYRFRNTRLTFDFANEDYQPPPDPVKDQLNEAVHDYRTREIGYNLLAVAPEYSRRDILDYLRDLEAYHQAEEEGSWLADIARALLNCEPENGKVPAMAVRFQLAIIYGVETTSKELPRPRTIMSGLKTLGFKKTRVGNQGLTGVLYDPQLASRLRARYLPPGVSSASSVSSAHEAENPSHAEATEDTEVSQQRIV